MSEFYISIALSIVALSISGMIFLNRRTSKESQMRCIMEIFKLLSDEEQRQARRKVFEAYRSHIIDEFGVLKDTSYSSDIEKVRSTLDLVGALIKNGYVPKNECLDMFMGIIIRCWNALAKNIEYDRKLAGNHFKLDFEWLAREAKIYWKMKYPNLPEPELF